MTYLRADDYRRERIEDLCSVASHLSAGRTITLDITAAFTFEKPPSRIVMRVSNEGEQKDFRDSFGTDLAWAIEREYFTYTRLDEWTGALAFGPNSQELLDQCNRPT